MNESYFETCSHEKLSKVSPKCNCQMSQKIFRLYVDLHTNTHEIFDLYTITKGQRIQSAKGKIMQTN